MGVLTWALLGVEVALAASLLVALKLRWTRWLKEYDEDLGWFRLWHERVWDESSGPGPT